MTTNDNNQNPVEGKPEGEGQPTAEEIRLAKAEYDELQKIKVEHGSYKRELKEARKALEDAKNTATPEKTKPEDSSLIKKAFLRASGLSDAEEQNLALELANKWHGGDVEKLLDDEDWSTRLTKHRAAKTNLAAANPKGGSPGVSGAKDTTAYWKAKGEPPTPADVPDRKTRQKIITEMTASAGNKGIKFHNE